MSKTLKFRPHLVPLVLEGHKDITWRLFDNKDLRAGDDLEFVNWETGETFAHAVAAEVREKPFAELTDRDLEGHEKFQSDEEMYATYSTYYGQPVTKDTLVKVIEFKLQN